MSKEAAVAECKKMAKEQGVLKITRYVFNKQPIFEPYRVYNGFRQLLEDANLIEDLVKAHGKLIQEWRNLKMKHGINIFNQTVANQAGYKLLVIRTSKAQLKFADIASTLGYCEEYEQELAGRSQMVIINQHGTTDVWTIERFRDETTEIIAKFGCIPSQSVLGKNGYSGYLNHIKQFGPDIASIRQENGVDNVEMRDIDNTPWLSFIEVATANFMLARGVKITKGEKYPPAYAALSGRKYGIYDMHFVALAGDQKGKKINVEIFGGSPGGRGNYAEVRAFKEQFHKDDPTFLALEYKECLTDTALLVRLAPFIGDRPVIRPHASRLAVPTTQLSIVNDTLKEAIALCEKMPDKKLPTSDWLTRNHEYKDRARYD